MLVDLKGTPWVIDYGEVHEGPVAYDIARLTTGMLFEYTPLNSELDLEAACRLTSELFAVNDLRQVPPLPCFDGLTPSLSFAAKSVHGLLGHLNGFTRKAQRNDRSHHDFHSLIFLLILLERTLRHLTYPQLSDLQKRWALRTAAKMSQRLRVVWDRAVPPEDSADDAVIDVANSSKSSLGPRFSARLWKAQRFDTFDVACTALHNTIAHDRDVIARLITELERECRENVQKAQAARETEQAALENATMRQCDNANSQVSPSERAEEERVQNKS